MDKITTQKEFFNSQPRSCNEKRGVVTLSTRCSFFVGNITYYNHGE